MPYEPDPGADAPEPQRLAFQSSREVRHTVIHAIGTHLRESAAVSWQGLTRLRLSPGKATILLRALLVLTRQHTTR